MSLAATVVVPTHDHGPTLRLSLASALAQTVEDIEVLVIGDGVPDVTREILADLGRRDERIRFFDHPKGPRNGEVYRHAALKDARGEVVCYLSDDDLWLPEHLETLVALLATLAAYRRLPEGWSTTPGSLPTDLFMWQKLLSLPDCRARSGTRPTVLHFPSPERAGGTLVERVDELERWWSRVADPSSHAGFAADLLDSVVRDRALIGAHALTQQDQLGAIREQLGALRGTRTWRLRNWLLRATPLGWAARARSARAARRGSAR